MAARRIGIAVLATLLVACAKTDGVTTPATMRGGAQSLIPPDDGCAASCALFRSSAPLWSAIADPDSVSVPVPIADVTFSPTVGGTVTLAVAGDSNLLASFPLTEAVDVTDGVTHVSVSLSRLSSPSTVWTFLTTDTVTLHFSLNRTLSSGPVSDSLALAIADSATLVLGATRPWLPRTSAAPSANAGRRAGAPSADDTPEIPTTCTTPVAQSGTFCGVGVHFSQVAPADAFLAAGAQFQSNAGHGVSHTINIAFDQPVTSVTVTAYDPTFDGNSMTAFDSTGAVIGTLPFPGNQHPGVLTTQTGSLSGSISSIRLTPAPADFVGYSMIVVFGGKNTLTLSPHINTPLAPSVKAFTSNICNVSAVISSRNYQATLTDASGRPMANQTVMLSVQEVVNSGGHNHDAPKRPGGSFVGGDTVTSISVVTNASGVAGFTYFAPEPGGLYAISAAAAGADTARDTVTVGISLSPLVATANMNLVGATGIHPDNHNATPALASALQAFGDTVHAWAVRHHTSDVLNVNDESLPLGGIFDLDANWAPSHCSHRRGTDADIRDRDLSPDLAIIVPILWRQVPGGGGTLREADHLHLKGAQ